MIRHPSTKLCHIITTVHNRLKGGGRVVWLLPLPCYAPPRWEGRQPRISRFPSIVFLCGAQTSISLFCSIVFVCVGTSSASFHRELWDFKSVEHCAIAPILATYSFIFSMFYPLTLLCAKCGSMPFSCIK